MLKSESESCNTDEEKLCTSFKLTSTPNKKKKKKFIHKYNISWEKHKEFKSWIAPSRKGNLYFNCKVCNEDYLGGISAVKRHNLSKKHTNKLNAFKNTTPLSNMSSISKNMNISKNIKTAEIKVAMFIAEHNISFQTADHLVSLIKDISKNIEVSQNMSCNRTKCNAIVKNVLGLGILENLLARMKNNKFSIIVDESTDCSSVKHLAVLVRMVINFTIKDEFLCLLPISNATAQNLYNVVTNFFIENSIDYKKQLIGLGADGANVMMGANNSFQSLLRNDIPNIFVLKCTCHSLALCASYASEKLPNYIEELVRDIYTYLHLSYKRQSTFKEFQKFLELKPHKILQISQTRWLSLHVCVTRLLEQYEALVLYFQSEYLIDKRAGSIFTKLKDPVVKLYLHFLDYVLPMLTKLNIEFQSEIPKIHTLYSKIATVYKTLLECYIDKQYLKSNDFSVIQYRNPSFFLALENIYFGGECMAILENDLNISSKEKHNFRINCLNFYIECVHQIYKRFPFKSEFMSQLKNLQFIDPRNIDKIISIAPVAIQFKSLLDLNIQELDNEWRLLRNYEHLSREDNFLTFWQNVNKIENGDGTKAFSKICSLISMILILPHSSAAVERIFSVINLNKTKIRNRLSTNTLCSILYCKDYLNLENKSCFNFNVSQNMLQKHNDNMYKN